MWFSSVFLFAKNPPNLCQSFSVSSYCIFVKKLGEFDRLVVFRLGKMIGVSGVQFTQFVINLSEGLQDNFLFILVFLIAFVMGFSELKKRSPAFRDALDRITLKLPIVGDLAFKSTIARYARTLSTTFSAGVPLIEALDACAGATGNVVYRNAVLKVKEDVSTGQQLQFAMRSTGVFPAMALQMTAIGEESGALDAMLEKVAIYYEEEVDNAVDGLTSMMEPLIMSVLGVLIGGLIIAMYLPIFQMGAVVG